MAFERFKKFNIDPLIAKQPATPRDSSRLMVLHRDTQTIEHRIFRDIHEYFHPGDVLVLNNTKVFPAKLFAHKATGGKVEVLLVRPQQDPQVWTVLTRDYKENAELDFGDGLRGVMLGKTPNNEATTEPKPSAKTPPCNSSEVASRFKPPFVIPETSPTIIKSLSVALRDQVLYL